jgi:hypothetical protein
MNTDALAEEEEDAEQEGQGEEQEPEVEEDEDEESDGDEDMDDDMRKLQNAFPGFKQKYRLIKRIGEGTCPCVSSFCALHLTRSSRHILYCLQSSRPTIR